MIKTDSGECSKKGEGGGMKKIGRKCRNIMSKMWAEKRIQGI